jgi:predicted lipid-binding transport protein (Tim44 family)
MSFDLTTIVFMGLALFLIWKLRSVLGEKNGEEQPPFMPSPLNRVIDAERVTPPPSTPDAPRWAGLAEDGSSLAEGFEAIAAHDANFDPKAFLEGAKYAYEMVLAAFAKGDRAVLKTLVTGDAAAYFEDAILEREKSGETLESVFIGHSNSTILEASTDARKYGAIKVQFVAKLMTALKDASGTVIDGSPDKTVSVTDRWVFTRNLVGRDPTWFLTEVEEEAVA